MWVLHTSTSPPSWELVDATGDQPGARASHSCAALGGSVFLFGGWSERGDPFLPPDLYKFDVEAISWSIVPVKGSMLSTPTHTCMIYGCISNYHLHHVGGYLWLYGPSHTNAVVSGLWVFAPEEGSWRDVNWQVQGALPPGRKNFGSAVVDSRIYVFGGSNLQSGLVISELWVLDASEGLLSPDAELVWTELSAGAVLGALPGSGYGAGLTALAGMMYVFGGLPDTNNLHVFKLPRQAPWPSRLVDMAALYDWDSIVLDGGAASGNYMPKSDVSLCRNDLPCQLRVAGPGTISASAKSSLSCRDSDGCTGVELRSLHFTGERREGGADHLFFSGAPLTINNSSLRGISVTVRAAVAYLNKSTFVDCIFVLEKGAQLSLLLSRVFGTTISSKPALFIYSGSSVSVETSRFENIHSVSSGAAFLV